MSIKWMRQIIKLILKSGDFWIFKMYQLYREDMGQIKKVAVLPNSSGPGSWEILHCLMRISMWLRLKTMKEEFDIVCTRH